MILVLLGLLVVLDRVAVFSASRAVAERIQDSQRLGERPEVSVYGFPFLTQLVGGRYGDIQVTVRGLGGRGPEGGGPGSRGPTGRGPEGRGPEGGGPGSRGLRVDSVRVRLHGVRLPLSAVVRHNVSGVPVRRGDADIVLTYADLNEWLAPRGLTVSAVRGLLRVTGTISVLGQSLSLSGDLGVTLNPARNSILLLPTAVKGTTGMLPGRLAQAATDALTIRLTLDSLPFGVHLDTARVRPDGLSVVASATDIVLRAAPE